MTDDEVTAWNQAVATGDPAVIEPLQHELLGRIHRRIMDDDPGYRAAGWRAP